MQGTHPHVLLMNTGKNPVYCRHRLSSTSLVTIAPLSSHKLLEGDTLYLVRIEFQSGIRMHFIALDTSERIQTYKDMTPT